MLVLQLLGSKDASSFLISLSLGAYMPQLLGALALPT